jgi:two-component system, sporulation sensor kinase C
MSDSDAPQNSGRWNTVAARHFRAVADSTYDWESWISGDGQLVWVNPGVERLTGYSVDDCHAMPDYPSEMIHPDDRVRVGIILEAARQGTSGNDAEFRIVHRNGGTKWVAISWQPIAAIDEGPLGFRTSVRDITDRRRLRDQLRLHAEHLEQLVQERTARIHQLEQHRRQMERLAALGQLAAGVAHEINNPLAGLRNAFELIKEDLTPQHPHFELLGAVDRGIERIGGIIHQMYQLYGRSMQAPIEFDLERTVRDVVSLLTRISRKRGIMIDIEIRDHLPPVKLPQGEVKQVLYNLILNAIQASPDGLPVRVCMAADRDEVQVAIQDRGPGIAPDVLPRVFDPFFSTKSHSEQGGMGLGLSVSQSLIEALGGRIEVDSSAISGSVFSAVFPRRVDRYHGGSADESVPTEDPDR